MKRRDTEFRLRRIAVALDASPNSIEALEAAAELASGIGAELRGIFVEDIKLLRLAGFPFIRELRYPSAGIERIDETRLQCELKALAERARKAIAATAKRAQLSWSFQVVRGEPAAEILAAAMQADLIVVGKMGRPLAERPRLGSTALAVAANAPIVLLVGRGATFRRPLAAVYDGSPQSMRTLDAVALFAGRNGKNLTTLIPAVDSNIFQSLAEEASEILRRLDLKADFKRLKKWNLTSILNAVQIEGCGALALSSSSSLLDEEEMKILLEKISCPVLLVR